jgi:hypothetical protein
VTRDQPKPAEPEERRYPIAVELTAREIAALDRAAWAITSTDDEHFRVNRADSAFRAFRTAVRHQRP